MEQFGNPINDEQYREALRSVRVAKNIFWWLIFAALAVQLAGLVLVRFIKVVDESGKMRRLLAEAKPAAPATGPTTEPAKPEQAPATQAAQAAPTPQTALAEPVDAAAEAWQAVLQWAMPVAKFIALAAGMLLVLTLLFTVKLSLLGRMAGVPNQLNAFFWSLLLWVMLIPWQQALPGSTIMCGAPSNLADLMADTAKLTGNIGLFTHVVYYARFAAYPLLAVVVWVWVQTKFACGYRRAMGIEPAEAGAGQPQGKI